MACLTLVMYRLGTATALTLSLMTTIAGCSYPSPSGATNSGTVESSSSEGVQPDNFPDAYKLAIQASERSQQAKTQQAWEEVSDLWQESIDLMKAVPESSPDYETAQQKVEEYQHNLDYAQQKANDPFPEAFSLAIQASEQAQPAQSQADWESVRDTWQQVIELMQTVPESSPNYATAQQKVDEYQANLDNAQTRIAEQLIILAVNYLDDNANWTDRSRGRELYDALKGMDGDLVTKALVQQVQNSNHRLQVLFLSVKLGIPGSEEALNQVLLNHGNQAMAEDYLNSGSSMLYEGGRQWANARGYEILTGPGSHRTSWGQF